MKNKNQRNKIILKSPMQSLVDYGVSLANEKLEQFKLIVESYNTKKHNLNQLIEERKVYSKQIGMAKKAGESTEELLIKVKQLSSEIDQISLTVKDIENQILIFFENGKDTKAAKETSVDKSISGEPDFVVDMETVRINLFDKSNEMIDDYLFKTHAASIYHQPKWLDVIKNSFNHKSYYFVAQSGSNKVIGVLPLVQLKSFLFGHFLISIPYFNYGGAIAISKEIESKLIEAANQLAKELGVEYVEYRDSSPRKNYPVKTDKVNMLLKLESSSDAMWQRFPSKLRSQIKKSLEGPITAQQGQLELLDSFYKVFAKNMRDLGTPVYAKSFFKNILLAFPKNTQIIIVEHQGKPVSAAFLIHYKGTLEIPWASTLREANHLASNMTLYWQVIQYAISLKCKQFDFGRSSKNSGTYRFKKQWGAKPQACYWHYWLNNGNEMPALNPSNPKFQLMIKTWQLMPVFLTKLIGPFIVKNLP